MADALSKPAFGDFTLHPHQITAVEWMIQRERDTNICGGFLCDEMGLGKTISTIGLLVNKPKPRTLVLGPLAVIGQWITALLSADGPAVFELVKKSWVLRGGSITNGRVYVTNYDKLESSPSCFTMYFDRLICDEAHILRSPKSKKYKFLKEKEVGFYWFLTGTPVVNSEYDFCNLLKLADKSTTIFLTRSMETLERWMATYALCRTIDDIRHLLQGVIPEPAKVVEHRVPFTTEEESNFYRGIQGIIANQIEHLLDQDRNHMFQVFSLILRLRQISIHPQIYINSMRKQRGYTRPDWIGDSTKVETIIDILKKENESHGYVIFCNFKDEVELLKERLSRESCVGKILSYTGEMNQTQREEVVQESRECMNGKFKCNPKQIDTLLESFKPQLPMDCIGLISDFVGPQHTILLAQIQCAGTGLNLQHMDRVIFLSPWWTAALMDQAAGRVLRLGQKNPVDIHYVWLKEEMESSLNIDDYMNSRVEHKRKLCKQLLAAARG
jgi:SNF2 family DNA or RNA helicase